MLHQWCFINDVSWCSSIFPLKKNMLQIGWSQDPFRTWGRVRVNASFGWNLSKVSQHQMELITNKNGKLNGEHERWNHGMFMFSIVSHHILTNHGTHGKCIVGNRVFHSFPMQTSWNHARMTERFVVNGSFVVRIILKLVKRLFELKIWPSSLPFHYHFKFSQFRPIFGFVAFQPVCFLRIGSSQFSHEFSHEFSTNQPTRTRTLCIGNSTWRSELCGSSLGAGLA